jgi:hypothetical protein
MTDHPLVPQDIKDYMKKHSIEENLNIALNHVLFEMPQDPFSSMAVKLIECNPTPPTIDHLEAHETYINDLN